MAKGVKKIKWIHKPGAGIVFPIPANKKMMYLVEAEKWIWFTVAAWEEGTTATERKKDIFWLWQDKDRRIILKKTPNAAEGTYALRIPKKLCGSYTYYIEASLSGKADSREIGAYVGGYCESKIISSKWSKTYDGVSITNTNDDNKNLCYGNDVFLHIETEGLNGDTLTIEIYNEMWNGDYKMRTIHTVQVIDGEVNLKISNTSQWQASIKSIQENEEFYFKVKDKKGKYILDEKEKSEHGKYLNIKNKLVSNTPIKPTNLTPTKVLSPDLNGARYEPCKYNKIVITETAKKDGKIEQTQVVVFEDGKNIKPGKPVSEVIIKTVHFDYNSANIDSESVKTLNNILQFLLEHPGSIINLSGHACVIGKQNYNNVLSQKRADVVKKFFADGKLDPRRITAIGYGEINATDDKKGRDNIKYKDELSYKDNRRVDIKFTFQGHNAETIVYETVAPSISTKKNLLIDITGFDTKSCFKNKNKHKKEVRVLDIGQALDTGDKEKTYPPTSFSYPTYSDLSRYNLFPIQYIWPMGTTPNKIYFHLHSCRYFSTDGNATFLVKVYPDIKWTLEFKWNHTYPFVYSYGNKLHPHDIETGKKEVIGSEADRGLSKNLNEMSQSFNLSLKAEWDEKSQSAELGKDFGEKIAKTLKLFNKIKSMTEKVSNSPVTKGKVIFEIKSPVIAFSAQWYLQRGLPTSPDISTIIVIGISAKPLVEASFTINLFKLFVETAGNAVCPGAGKVITWVMDKLESNAGIHFLVIFAGGIYVDGKVTINTSYPKETKGEVKATGKIQVTIEFKAWAKAGSANIGVDGVIKADASTSVTGGIKVGADKKGIYSSPVAEFGGIKATFVAAATVKFGVFKRSFTYEDEAILVEPDEIKFNKYYLDL